jgi:hypothetical protein
MSEKGLAEAEVGSVEKVAVVLWEESRVVVSVNWESNRSEELAAVALSALPLTYNNTILFLNQSIIII